MSLLEKVRREGAVSKEAWVFGFDPDINNSGYCSYHFRYNPVGMIQALNVHMGVLIPKAGTKRMAKAVGMSRAVYDLSIEIPMRCPLYALIEGQEIYHNDKDPLATTVAKANDLLLLAYVSGAIVHKLQTIALDTKINLVKPKEWKKNAKKPAMHADFLSHMEKSNAVVTMDGQQWDREPPNIHTLDACCMCLKSAEKIAKGVWK
jgi:hypothetical protein